MVRSVPPPSATLPSTTLNTHRSDPSQDFVALFLAHQARIYAFIVTLLGNRSDADDVLQETGITLFQKFSTFQPGTDFLAWACRVAKNKVMDFGSAAAGTGCALIRPRSN